MLAYSRAETGTTAFILPQGPASSRMSRHKRPRHKRRQRRLQRHERLLRGAVACGGLLSDAGAIGDWLIRRGRADEDNDGGAVVVAARSVGMLDKPAGALQRFLRRGE